ncbi:hypothetical protein [Pararhodobacter sp.]|uniref:hypothetical protein n=1 Tax=Pararhodobacter sp. TaxID=2127056 RepID=UPI002AFEA05F|nr:hypothetical protein [Pararhodobacter sp.]
MRWAWILAFVLMAVGLAPVASMALAKALAALSGCTISETFPQPCVIWGGDWGGLLNRLFTTGWLMFLTAPAALTGFALAIGLAAASLIRRTRE